MSAKNWASKGHKKEITVTVPHWWKNGTAAVASIILALLSLMIIGCQLGPVEQPASTPLPTAAPLPPPTPTLEERRMPVGAKIGNNTKALDGDLHVWYIPCGNQPATWVAPIVLSDLRSGSHVYLNQDGTLKASP